MFDLYNISCIYVNQWIVWFLVINNTKQYNTYRDVTGSNKADDQGMVVIIVIVGVAVLVIAVLVIAVVGVGIYIYRRKRRRSNRRNNQGLILQMCDKISIAFCLRKI